jgi:hypothetical protein
MKYQYSAVVGQLNIDGRTTKRPVVEVELTRGNYHRTFLALIDSGADQILMPAAIADGLGIDRNRCPHRSSMGITMDSIDGFVAELSIRLQHQEPFTAPVVFIDTEVPILLGREGFFDQHRIKFEQDHDTFEITQRK